MKRIKDLVPKYAIHPGRTLIDELQARKIKQSVFCRKHGFSTSEINYIVRGKRNINAKIAIALDEALGISAEFWMRLQAMYDLDKERIKQKKHYYFKRRK